MSDEEPPTVINLKQAESEKRQPPPQDAQEWGVRNVVKCTDMSEALIKLAENHSNVDLFNTVMMTDNLLPFAAMFSGPYVEVVHSFGMYRNFLKPDGKETGIWGFVGDATTNSTPTAVEITKTWLTSKTSKQGPKDESKIEEQVKTKPRNCGRAIQTSPPLRKKMSMPRKYYCYSRN